MAKFTGRCIAESNSASCSTLHASPAALPPALAACLRPTHAPHPPYLSTRKQGGGCAAWPPE
eukprot:6931911-Prorocentrum_lima.AAC.1